MLITHVSRGAAASFPASTLQVGSNADNGSGGGYTYRASKAALNISALSLKSVHKTRQRASFRVVALSLPSP